MTAVTMSPRRRTDWVQTILTGLILFVLGYAADGISGLKKNVAELNLKVARLETTIQVGMQDRFTGQEGKALADRLSVVETRQEAIGLRVNSLEKWCSSLAGEHRNKGP